MKKATPFVRQIKNGVVVFIFLCLLLFCGLYSQLRTVPVRFLDQHGETRVLSLSVKDKKRLLGFIRLLFAEDSFAYTLLGPKPVSWACYRNPFPFINLSSFCDSFGKYNRTLRLGWKTWAKYRHLFPSVAFWEENMNRNPGWISILMVNEEQFNRVVNNDIQDFQDVLRRHITDGFQLLREANSCSLMDEVLEQHQALIGIILGYGRENSWAFLENSKKREPLGCVWNNNNEQIPNEIQTRMGAADIEDCLALESCPYFAGHPNSEESLALKKAYLLTRKKVIDYYKNKDFLEATLSLLAGFRPVD